MNIKQLLEKFQIVEMAMYENPRKDFGEFREYVINNPKAKKTYFVLNGKIRIPSDTILHSIRRHKLTLDQWKEFFECFENIIDQKESSKSRYGGKAIIYLVEQDKNKHFCYVLESFNEDILPIITTVFEDHINSIKSWMNTQK